MSDINPKKTDAQYNPRESAQRWEKELAAAEKELSKFHTAAKRITRKYLDQRDDERNNTAGDFKSNFFWSNIQVLKASLYAKPPRVDVSNAYKDSEDDVSRVSGNILERMLNHAIERDESDFDIAAQDGVGDYLIVGCGQVWYRYEVETAPLPPQQPQAPAVAPQQPITPAAPQMPVGPGMQQTAAPPVMQEPMQPQPVAAVEPKTPDTPGAQPGEVITWEDCLTDHVYWEDFWWSPARKWEEVRWVAKRVFMNREQLKQRFGERVGALVPLSKQKVRSTNIDPQNDPWEKAGVFEIWDKTTKKVYWHVRGMDAVCDEQDDPLQLERFFPCPAPLMSNLTSSKFLPRADYQMCQDQYQQIDELTTRIAYLTRACKVVGVRDKNATSLERMFNEGIENQLLPVDAWFAFAEKGGIKGSMDLLPTDTIAATIDKLTAQLDIQKNRMYEVIGIGDIMRGMSNPDETLGAQQLKAQFGGSRLQFKQMEIGKWVASGQRIRAEIICKHFQPQTILDRSNIMQSPDKQYAQQALDMLKNFDSYRYKIRVESETMAMVDWAQERDSRVQYLQALGGFVQSMTPLLQEKPEVAPVALQLLKWGLGGFRVGKEIESTLDQAIATAQQPTQPPPLSPKEQADIDEKKASATQKRSAAVKNIAEARGTHIDNQLKPMQMAIDAHPEPPFASGEPPQPPPQQGAM